MSLALLAVPQGGRHVNEDTTRLSNHATEMLWRGFLEKV